MAWSQSPQREAPAGAPSGICSGTLLLPRSRFAQAMADAQIFNTATDAAGLELG